MLRLSFALLVSLSSYAHACPNLEGYFAYPGAAYLSISQAMDSHGVTTYQVTIDDGTCAACHTDQYLKADNILKVKSYADGKIKETSRISCAADRLKFRQTTEYFIDDGSVYTETLNQDYRTNADNNLVVENMENETPVSKTILPRFTDF
jgi:hypothetical protein